MPLIGSNPRSCFCRATSSVPLSRRLADRTGLAASDEQLEGDVAAGRLDALAEEALADHAAGRTREL